MPKRSLATVQYLAQRHGRTMVQGFIYSESRFGVCKLRVRSWQFDLAGERTLT